MNKRTRIRRKKDDYVGDLFDIAGAARMIVERMKTRRRHSRELFWDGVDIVKDLPDAEAEARLLVPGLDTAMEELETARVGASGAHALIARYRGELGWSD